MSGTSFGRGLLPVAVALVIGTAAAFAQSPYASDMQAGREAFDGSNFVLAERYFKGAVDNAQSDGQRGTALYSLAVAAQKQGKVDEAKEHAGKALELSPKNSQARRLLEELAAIPEKPAGKGKSAKAEPPREQKAALPANAAEPPPAERPQPRKAPLAAAKSAPEKSAGKEGAPSEAPARTAEQSQAVAPQPAREPRAGVETGAIPAPKAKQAPPAAAPAVAASPAAPAATEAPVVATLGGVPAGVLAAGFYENDHRLALLTGPSRPAAAADQSIDLRRREASAGTELEALTLHSEITVGHVAMPQAGSLLATAVPLAAEGKQAAKKGVTVSVHVWDTTSVDNKHAIEMPIPDAAGNAAGIDAMAFSRNGRRLVVAHRTGIEILDTNGLRGAAAYRFSPRQRTDGADAPASLAVSSSGRHAVLTNGTRLRVVDGATVRDIGTGSKVFELVALSDDGKLIAATSGPGVRFFDLASGKESEALPDSAGEVTAIAFSPGGDRLAVASGDAVKVFAMPGRKALFDLAAAARIERLAFSSDGKALLAAGQKGSRAWRLTGEAQAARTEEPRLAALAPPPVAAPVKSDGAPEAKEAKADPGPQQAKKPTVDQIAARNRALAKGDCDRVKELDAEISDPGEHGACLAKVEQARKDAERGQRIADRRLAVDAGDCSRVKALDAEIGDAAQHGACVERQERKQREAERGKLTADHKAALEKLDCEAARALDVKLALGDERALQTCTFQSVIKTGSARELYLAAVKYDADKDRGSAKQLYRAIVDRFPQDDLAIKAAERMLALADQEGAEGGKAKGAKQPRR